MKTKIQNWIASIRSHREYKNATSIGITFATHEILETNNTTVVIGARHMINFSDVHVF